MPLARSRQRPWPRPGPMAAAESISHHVYVGPDVVVKIIDAGGHSRLDREIALAPCLPAGLTAPLLGSGLCRLGTREVRYACYARVPGTAPGMGMPGVDSVTARLLAEEAVQRLGGLHSWTPAGRAEQTLGEPLDHGGSSAGPRCSPRLRTSPPRTGTESCPAISSTA